MFLLFADSFFHMTHFYFLSRPTLALSGDSQTSRDRSHVVYCYLFAHARLLCFTIWLRHVLPSIYTPSSLGCISLALISQVISSPTLYLQIVGQHRTSKTLRVVTCREPLASFCSLLPLAKPTILI